MAKEEMRSCPFCGMSVAFTYPWLSYLQEDKVWVFSHFCKTDDKNSHFLVSFTAKTKEEIIDRWNGKTIKNIRRQ